LGTLWAKLDRLGLIRVMRGKPDVASAACAVVEPRPAAASSAGDGNPSDAAIVGRVLLAGKASTVQDDTVIGNPGMGGQGVLPVPVIYNGWVQQWVKNCKTKDCKNWNGQLTDKQKNPGPVK